jgi:hypothetical protein
MTFNYQKLQELARQLPQPSTMADAYLLAELACICHHQLWASRQASAEFWLGLDANETQRLEQFLRDANDGVSNLANDLHYISEKGVRS